MNEKLIEMVLNNAAPIAIILTVISAFIWSTVMAVVFLITKTRSRKLFGAEFDPEKPHTDRRVRK